MWFHRSFRADEWLLYAQESPSSSRARGFATGHMFTRDGRAHAVGGAEGLIRPVGRAKGRS
jgi:acyl-CoA thioesterase-2